ncbi:hypothetical protein GPECTOR_49g511 [Gonium pectorale]|uniref:Cyclin-like domain-containing protein n=1 Tax=Gonium pectorale TaxID=33097 RepID=A0A150G7V4_GONPE|nr:hypothetical protein GPECTOR_49g511 [Gonium pectorale]|eukprot:KXZ45927.1 hypothetical protein GPECTOR_49g511 [Gonium pectorale]
MEPPPVPLAGELLMLKYYQQIIQEKCRELRLPVKVMSTAVQYYKRFFLRHTSMEFDPGRVMITAIFMATKVEEYFTRASVVAAAFLVTEESVVKQEVALLEGLNFDLVVHSPYRALQGLVQPDQQPALPPLDEGLASAPDALVGEVARSAERALDALMLSDAPLLFGPAQLAAAALRSGCKTRGLRIPNFIARLALRAAARQGDEAPEQLEVPADPAAALTAVLDELDFLGSEGARKVEVEEVKEANVAAREWRTLLKSKDKDGGAGAGGGAKGGAAGDDAARAAKRDAKKAARAAAKAKQEAELLGMPQQQ